MIPTKTKDTYMYFISKAIDLLKTDGHLGFIISDATDRQID